MDASEVARSCSEAGTRMVRLLFCDCTSIIRTKCVHIAHLMEFAAHGVGLSLFMQALNILDDSPPEADIGEVGESYMLPDLQTFTVLGYVPWWAAVMVDLVDESNHPSPICPRQFLRRMINRCRAHGFEVRAAFENEFTLARQEADSYAPIDRSPCKSTAGVQAAAEVVQGLVDALTGVGLDIEQYYVETGPGQQEITMGATWGIRPADDQVLFRETVREVSRHHGLVASFAPKPFPNAEANGCHLHFSLWDLQRQTNLLYDTKRPNGLSEVGRSFIAGVLVHLPGLMALTCPTVNSYRRLQPGVGTSAYVCWGPNNREAAIRFVPPAKSTPMAWVNGELKACDPSCNPYLALGGLLASGLDGITRKLQAPPPLLQDPCILSDEERAELQIRQYPLTLAEAIDALEADDALCEALGPELVAMYTALKRSDVRAFASNDIDFEFRSHFATF